MKVKNIFKIDYFVFFAVLALVIVGVLFIYSSGINSSGVLVSKEYIKQIIWGSIGLVFALIFTFFDYRRLYNTVIYIYIGFLFLLLYTLFFGKVVNGARSWIGFASLGIQPSEFAKIATILLLARHFEETKNRNDLKRVLVALFIVVLPAGLILLQPDLGTALVYIPILLGMSFIAGVRKTYLWYMLLFLVFFSVFTVLPFWHTYILHEKYPFLSLFSNFKTIFLVAGLSASIGLIGLFGYLKYKKKYFSHIVYYASILSGTTLFSFVARKVLKEYQIMRLIVFVDPQVDPRGSGWNIIQSTTAIGSGGLWGKGFLQGTQSHYRFLPQQSTDFIFSIFSEEWGFIGGIGIFVLFLIMLFRFLSLIRTTGDGFGANIVAGIASIIYFHFVINVGMTLGIMPITGIPLPFLSYGGSALWTFLIGIGFYFSIYVKRFDR